MAGLGSGQFLELSGGYRGVLATLLLCERVKYCYIHKFSLDYWAPLKMCVLPLPKCWKVSADLALFLQAFRSWVDGGNGRGVLPGTRWNRTLIAVITTDRCFKSVLGCVVESWILGERGAGGAWSRTRNIAGNSNRMNEVALTLLH